MKLSELQNIVNLNYTQQTVLAIVGFSATPKQAYATTTGDAKLVSARDTLGKMGFLLTSNGELGLTNRGQDALISYNLKDETGEPTEFCRELLNQSNLSNLIQSGE
jgi:hypothetical protein